MKKSGPSTVPYGTPSRFNSKSEMSL